MEPTLVHVNALTAAATPRGDDLVELLPVAVLVCDLSGRIVSRNEAYHSVFGDRAPYRWVHLCELLDDKSRPRLPELIAQASACAGRNGVVEIVAGCLQADASPLQCNVMVRVLPPASVGAAHLVVMVRPMGEETRQIERLRLSEHRFSTLLRHLPMGIIGSESGLRADYVNAAGAEVFGAGPESLLGLGWLDFIHPDDADRAGTALEEALSDQRPAFVPLRIVRADGVERWAHLRVAPVGVGHDLGFVASVEDVTEQRELGDALSYQARHDPLTGLLNRSMVEERLREYLDRAVTDAARPVVVFVDLDDFKDINDSLGHLIGDRVLAEMADRLFACAQPQGAVARFGGDEFVLIVPHLPNADAALALAHTVVDALTAPVKIDGHDLHCSASAGVTWLAPDDVPTANPSELLRRADLALYQAKRAGKGRAVLASDELLAGERRRLRLTGALRRAVHEDRLEVHYQPIVDLSDDRIVGLEALVRWTDPELGHIDPDVFVPHAEANGLVAALGRNVMRQALGELAAWRQLSGYERLYVSVNMSMHELDEQAITRQLATALGEADLPADALCVELTESALLRRETTAVERLDAIRRLGVRLAIDDFGTGYSSLARLRHLPVDLVKIDMEFVRGLGEDDQAGAVVGAIVNLASAMGLRTVAEGIETEAQLAAVRRVAGGYGQGYLFSQPLPARQVPDLLLRHPMRKVA